MSADFFLCLCHMFAALAVFYAGKGGGMGSLGILSQATVPGYVWRSFF